MIKKDVRNLFFNEKQYLRNWCNFSDKWAKKYKNPQIISGYGNTWSNNKINYLINDIRTKLEIESGEYLLDVGCGSGFILKEIHGDFKNVVGLDLSTEMLLHTKQNKIKNLELVNGELANLPFKDNYFDRVLCYFVFINLPSLTYAEKAVEELIRITKENGIILIGQVPNLYMKEQWFFKTTSRQHGHMQQLRSIIKKILDSSIELLHGNNELQQTFKFYNSSFFVNFLNSKNIKYEILDSFNPLYEKFEEEKVTANYRMDIKITK